MALNMFVIKKWVALTAVGVFPVVAFFAGLTLISLIGAIAFWLMSVLLMVILAVMLLRNPFTSLVEGKGVLIEDENSTGVIRLYICKVKPPNIEAKIGDQLLNESFDREAVYQLASPVSDDRPLFKRLFGQKEPDKQYVQQITEQNATKEERAEGKVGGLRVSISEDVYNKGRFALFHYPLLKYNSQIGGIVTKDFLSDQEKDAFAEHGILNLNRRAESLDQSIRNYARYVVDTVLKPKAGLFSKGWLWIVILVFVIGALLYMFWPHIMQAFGGVANIGAGAAGGASPITPGVAIVPKP